MTQRVELYRNEALVIQYENGVLFLLVGNIEITMNSAKWQTISSKIQGLENPLNSNQNDFIMYPMFEDD
jgi:hypothetical protein